MSTAISEALSHCSPLSIKNCRMNFEDFSTLRGRSKLCVFLFAISFDLFVSALFKIVMCANCEVQLTKCMTHEYDTSFENFIQKIKTHYLRLVYMDESSLIVNDLRQSIGQKSLRRSFWLREIFNQRMKNGCSVLACILVRHFESPADFHCW